MKISLLAAAVAAALTLAVPAYAVNNYSVTASTTPSKAGTKAKPSAIGLKLGFTAKDSDGGRPMSMEKLTIDLPGVAANTNAFAKCSVKTIEQDMGDKNCPKGSLIATGYAQNLAGDRSNRKDASIKCYLTLRLHNSGNNKLALLVKGDPQAPAGKTCPIALSTAIPVTISKSSKGSAMKLSIPESLKHPVASLTNSVVEMNLKVDKMTKKSGGRTVGLLESTGGCTAGARPVTLTFNNEGGNVAKQSTKARCS